MSTQNETGFKTFLASGAISAFRAVAVQSDGTITPVAGNAAVGIGVTQSDIADAAYGAVRLWTAAGTMMIAVSGSAVTPATTYGIITGGYAGAVNGTFAPASLIGLYAGVASNGIVLEFAHSN